MYMIVYTADHSFLECSQIPHCRSAIQSNSGNHGSINRMEWALKLLVYVKNVAHLFVYIDCRNAYRHWNEIVNELNIIAVCI
jgi:hypothetical protein